MEVINHEKLESGDFLIELKVDDGKILSYTWGPAPLNSKGKPSITDKQYFAMQLREATALAELATS